MANSFSGIAVFGYQGTTWRLPVKLPQGVAAPANQVPPSICPVTIDWNLYWQLGGNPSSVGVSINLQAASIQASILDRIASVKIDNTGSSCSVYVQFPDTGDVINCPPNCSVTFPCLTAVLNANIYAVGLQVGFIPVTRVFFYNIVLPPAVDPEINQGVSLYKASPTITRGNTLYNENYGVPALGDQLFSSNAINLQIINSTVPLWGTPYASGFLYINSLQINAYTLINNVAGGFEMVIESTGLAGNLITVGYLATTAVQIGVSVLLGPLTNLQVKLDATQTWRLRSVTGPNTGNAQIISSFTQSPI